MHRVELKELIVELVPEHEIYVPNAPCGVESLLNHCSSLPLSQFLMHRVELKVSSWINIISSFVGVPNAPCGVESLPSSCRNLENTFVPNAPCGVESLKDF